MGFAIVHIAYKQAAKVVHVAVFIRLFREPLYIDIFY